MHSSTRESALSRPDPIPQGKPAVAVERKNRAWARWGGGSLLFAAGLHALLLVIGAFWIFEFIHEPEKRVDFAVAGGGGGGGSSGARQQVQQKQQARIMPVNSSQRVFATGATSSFVIPEQGSSFSEMSAPGSTAGGLGGGGGMGGSGTGSGSGNGSGKGFGNGGMGPAGFGIGGGIKLFGTDLKVNSIGVVLDVSPSMKPDLPRVLKEINRVAKNCPVILHVGCGIGSPPGEASGEIKQIVTGGEDFLNFWARNQNGQTDDSVYEMLAKRPATYYHDKSRTGHTAGALLAPELRGVEAIYWFADFQDGITPAAADAVREALLKNNQKLFIHAFDEGTNFKTANDMIAAPTGGGRIKKGSRK